MTIDHYFEIHGVTVRLTGKDPQVMEQTLEELRFFQCGPLPSPHIHASLIQMNDLNINKSDLAGIHHDPGDEVNWIRENIASVLNIPRRSLSLYVTDSCPADAAVVILFGTIGFLVHLQLSLQGNVAAFHGASLLKDGQGLLLLGKTNSGKTSLSYLLKGHGFSYLSEEDSFIRMDGAESFRILPYPRRIRITEQVMKQQTVFARLQSDSELLDSLDEKVFRIDNREPPPGKTPLNRIILLDNDTRHSDVSMEPLRKTEAFCALLLSLEGAAVEDSPKTAWKDLKTRNRTSFNVAKSMVDSLAVNRLKYNIIRDFSALPGIINDIFEAD